MVSTDQIASSAEPLPVALTFAASGAWPDDVDAIADVKSALHIQIAESLNKQVSRFLVCFARGVGKAKKRLIIKQFCNAHLINNVERLRCSDAFTILFSYMCKNRNFNMNSRVNKYFFYVCLVQCGGNSSDRLCRRRSRRAAVSSDSVSQARIDAVARARRVKSRSIRARTTKTNRKKIATETTMFSKKKNIHFH